MESTATPPEYLDEAGLAALAESDRLAPVLIRLDRGRLTCPAQAAAGIIGKLESRCPACGLLPATARTDCDLGRCSSPAAAWYVRDVSRVRR